MKQARVSVTSNKSTAECQFVDGGWLPLFLGGLMFSAIFLPYFIVVFRGTLNPFLPFVSQAAGSPPQSGVFSVFMSLSALIGFIAMHLLHLGIRIYKQRTTGKKQHFVDMLNKASLIPGHLSLLGMIVTGGYPVDFHRHEENWIAVTIGPHISGAATLFTCGVIYCSIISVIVAIVMPENKGRLAVRMALLSITLFSAAVHAFTIRNAFMTEYLDESRLKSCKMEPLKYDTYYLISAISEWVLVIAFVCFFMTFYYEAKGFTFRLTVILDDDALIESPMISSCPSPTPTSPALSSRSSSILMKKDKDEITESREELSIKNGHS